MVKFDYIDKGSFIFSEKKSSHDVLPGSKCELYCKHCLYVPTRCPGNFSPGPWGRVTAC